MSIERLDPTKLPAIRQWVSQYGGKMGIWDYLSQQGGASLAVACSYLFWPSFIEVNGCVLLEERYEPENFHEWWERLSGNIPEVEDMINHVHLWDIFYLDEDELPDGKLEELACVMAKCWECALSEALATRQFWYSTLAIQAA